MLFLCGSREASSGERTELKIILLSACRSFLPSTSFMLTCCAHSSVHSSPPPLLNSPGLNNNSDQTCSLRIVFFSVGLLCNAASFGLLPSALSPLFLRSHFCFLIGISLFFPVLSWLSLQPSLFFIFTKSKLGTCLTSLNVCSCFVSILFQSSF